ncbi:MAG: hypothetical protein AAF525_08695 [Pseudomonadota bacterium]
MRAIYVLPLGYFLATRVPGTIASISWAAIYIVPLLLIGTLAQLPLIDAIAIQLLAMVIIYTIYELGYLQNDALTTRTETSPTLRLTPDEMLMVGRWFPGIILARVIIAALLLALLETLNPPGLDALMFCIVILIPTFLTYNLTRGAINVPLHFILVSVRFSAPVLVLIPETDVMLVLYLILMFPLINTMERAAEPRYELAWLQRNPLANQTSGRWIYYLGFSIVWTVICITLDLNVLTLIPIVYLFAYRLLSPVLLSKLALSRTGPGTGQ